MHPSIPSHQIGRMFKERLVMGYGRDGLAMLVGVLQDLVARHDTALHLIEDDLPSKLDLGASLVAWDGARVRLKEAEHFVGGGHLLALEHARPRLGDDAFDQR